MVVITEETHTISDEVQLSPEDCPTCIFRGGEGKISDRLNSDEFWHPRKTLHVRLGDAVYRFLTWWQSRRVKKVSSR